MAEQLSNLNYQEFAIANGLCENWLVNDAGNCQPYFPDADVKVFQPYRLYHFLSDLDRVLAAETDEIKRLKAVIPLVRQLLTSAEWLHTSYDPPNPETGWSVRTLYQEPDYPITVQTVAWNPGNVSPIHNHATWGIVAVIDGAEKNTFWRRVPTKAKNRQEIERVSEQILSPGNIIGFTSDAIHCVEPLGTEPAVTFNLYGVTDFSQRYEFNITNHTASNF